MKLKGYIECTETGSIANNCIVDAAFEAMALLMTGAVHKGFKIAVAYTDHPRTAEEIYNLKDLSSKYVVKTDPAVVAEDEPRVKVPYECDFLMANELEAVNEMGLFLGDILFSRVPVKEIIKTEDVRFTGTWNIKVIEYEPATENYVVDEQDNVVVDQLGLIVIA